MRFALIITVVFLLCDMSYGNTTLLYYRDVSVDAIQLNEIGLPFIELGFPEHSSPFVSNTCLRPATEEFLIEIPQLDEPATCIALAIEATASEGLIVALMAINLVNIPIYDKEILDDTTVFRIHQLESSYGFMPFPVQGPFGQEFTSGARHVIQNVGETPITIFGFAEPNTLKAILGVSPLVYFGNHESGWNVALEQLMLPFVLEPDELITIVLLVANHGETLQINEVTHRTWFEALLIVGDESSKVAVPLRGLSLERGR